MLINTVVDLIGCNTLPSPFSISKFTVLIIVYQKSHCFNIFQSIKSNLQNIVAALIRRYMVEQIEVSNFVFQSLHLCNAFEEKYR